MRHKKACAMFGWITVFLIFVTGCSENSNSHRSIRDKEAVAVVNSEKLPIARFRSALDEETEKYGIEDREDLKPEELLRLKTKTLNQLVLTTLFRQEAKKNGISINNEEFEQVLGQVKSGYEEDSFQRTLQTNDIEQKNWEKNLENNLLTKNLIDRVVNSRVKVGEEEIRDYFEAHPDEFQMREQIKTLHIMVETEEEARKILKKLNSGKKDFSGLAREYSKGPEGDRGGDMGYFEAGQMPEEFDSIFKLKKNKISDVIRTPFGFHIFKIEDKKPARMMSFEESESLIRDKLLETRQEEAFHEWLMKLKEKAKIEVNHEIIAEIQ
ncbi:MAG: peptidyl-prolyl cis-trans isomerase [Nitrospinales bacterium]